MFWAIILLVLSVFSFVLAAYAFVCEPKPFVFAPIIFLVGVVVAIFSSINFYTCNVGPIDKSAWSLEAGTTYRVVSCVKITSGGDYDGQYIFNLQDATDNNSLWSVINPTDIKGPFVRAVFRKVDGEMRWVLESIPISSEDKTTPEMEKSQDKLPPGGM